MRMAWCRAGSRTGILACVLLAGIACFASSGEAQTAQPPPADDALRKQAEAVVELLVRQGVQLERNFPSYGSGGPRFFYHNKEWSARAGVHPGRSEWRAVSMNVYATVEETRARWNRHFDLIQRDASDRLVDVGTCGRAFVGQNNPGSVTGYLLCGNIVLVFEWSRNSDEPGRPYAEIEQWYKQGVERFVPELRTLVAGIGQSMCQQNACTPGAAPSAPAIPPDPRNPCEKDTERWLEASYRARMLADQLAVYENLLVELDRQYENTRRYGFWTATADVSTLAVSVYWKYPTARLLTRFYGGQAAKEIMTLTLTWKLMESSLKGMLKESFKDLVGAQAEQYASLEESVKRVGKKGGEEAAKKLVVEGIKAIVQDIGEGRLRLVTPGPGTRLPSASGAASRTNYVKIFYSEPVGDAVNWLWSAYTAYASASSNLARLEQLRTSLRQLRAQRVAPLRQQWESAKQDLEVARAAYDHCLKLYPAAKEAK